MDKRYLSETEEAERIGMSPRTLARWRAEGGGPPFIRSGVKRVLYDPSLTDEWLAKRAFPHRAAELAAAAA